MTLTINLSADEEARLQREAEAQGVEAEELARRLIDQGLPSEEPRPKTGREALAYWRRKGALGLFADRGDTQTVAEELRRNASTRQW